MCLFYCVYLSLIFKETVLLFSKVDVPVYPPTNTDEFQSLHMLANTQ